MQFARCARCREFLRSRTDFAFNATNLLKNDASAVDRLVRRDYSARIELVYLEPTFDCLLRQNKNRSKSVPVEVVRKLAAKDEPPTWTEAHRLILVGTSG